jgi:hypothetical protein
MDNPHLLLVADTAFHRHRTAQSLGHSSKSPSREIWCRSLSRLHTSLNTSALVTISAWAGL